MTLEEVRGLGVYLNHLLLLHHHAPPVKEGEFDQEDEESESETDEDEEVSHLAGVTPKCDPARRPPEPARPPKAKPAAKIQRNSLLGSLPALPTLARGRSPRRLRGTREESPRRLASKRRRRRPRRLKRQLSDLGGGVRGQESRGSSQEAFILETRKRAAAFGGPCEGAIGSDFKSGSWDRRSRRRNPR